MVSSFIYLWNLWNTHTEAYLTIDIAVVGLLAFATLKKVFSPAMTQVTLLAAAGFKCLHLQ